MAAPPVAPRVVARPTGFTPQRFNPYVPRTIAQPPANLANDSPVVQSLNPTVASVMGPRSGAVQQPLAINPVTRQTELRPLAEMRLQRGVVTREGNIVDSIPRQTELRTLQKTREHRDLGIENQTLAAIDPHRHATAREPDAPPQPEQPQFSKETHGKKGHNRNNHIGYDEAFRRHWHEWHDRNWWHDHCQTIVFVPTGYYFLDGSYWYPAWGYDPLQSYYDYDGPVYTYSNLLPDEVIANVQTALQDAGYYFGAITGSLTIDTRAALANFQRDYGLPITGAIDESTVEALGLY
jgi:hypothetical protein